MSDKILRLREIVDLTGLSRSTIYRYQELGEFPKSIKLGPRCIGWTQSSIEKWLDNLMEKNGRSSGS